MFKTADLIRRFDDARAVLTALGGDLGHVSFDPSDAASVETAIRDVNAIIDDKLRPYLGNPMLASVADELKERYCSAISVTAAAARLWA